MMRDANPLSVRKAVIPAAGMGTRFLPATKSMPKEMLPIVDTPVLQFVIEEAVASGIDDILIVTGRGKRAIENHFDFNPELEGFLAAAGKHQLIEQVRGIGDRARIHFIRQKEQLGLGDAIRLGRDHVGDQPFAVLLGDTIIDPPDGQRPGLRQILDVFEEKQASVVAVHHVPRRVGEPLRDRGRRAGAEQSRPGPAAATGGEAGHGPRPRAIWPSRAGTCSRRKSSTASTRPAGGSAARSSSPTP